ncbi:hypothetical protein HN51_059868, partial [Arachis hypogaea]
VAEPTRSPPHSEGPPRRVAVLQSPPPRSEGSPPLFCPRRPSHSSVFCLIVFASPPLFVALVQLFFTADLLQFCRSPSNEFAIPGMNSNEFNMGEGGENEFIGDPQQNLIEEEDEHVNDDDDFVDRVEPEPERNDVSDEDGEDDDVDAMEDEDIGGFEF